MPQALGDFPVNGIVAFLWNTNDQTGASITRSTDGTLKIFKANATAATWATERSSLAGVTQLEDFDATGMHSVHIDLSNNTDAGFYAAGNEYQVAIVGAVVDTKTVNVPLASFSIERANGILALLKSGTFGLSALKTLIDAVDDLVDTEVAAIKSDTAAILADTGTDGVVLNAAGLAADAVAEIADAVWDEDATGHQTTGTFGQAIGDPVADTNTIYKAVVTDAAGATVGVDVVAVKADTAAILVDTGTTLDGRIPAALTADGNMKADTLRVGGTLQTAGDLATLLTTIDDFIDTEVAAIKAKTDSLTFTDAGKVDATLQLAADLKAAVANRIADHILRRLYANARVSSDGDALNKRSLLGAEARLVNKTAPNGANLEVMHEDDVTVFASFAITTNAAADPITALDPA